jgi:hypothetical protein
MPSIRAGERTPHSFGQFCARTVEPRLDRLGGDPEHLGGLLLAQAFDGAQHQHRLEAVRQRGDGARGGGEFGAVGGEGLGQRRVIGDPLRRAVGQRHPQEPPHRLPPREIAALVERDRGNPSAKGARRIIARKRGEGGDEGILRDIEGLLDIARGGAGETIDRLAVALDQRALRPAVARQRPAHQRCIEIGPGHLSFWARLCAIAASKRAC